MGGFVKGCRRVLFNMATNEELVARFQGGDESALELLVASCSRLIAKICRKYSPNPNWEAADDVYQSALIGLWDAAGKYDLSAGVKFNTYAVRRIAGAVLDHLRTEGTIRIGRAASKEVRAQFSNIVRLDHPIDGNDENDSYAWYEDRGASNPLSELLNRDNEETLSWALSRLPDRERVIAAALIGGETQKRAGELGGISESRVSQMRRQLIEAVTSLVSARNRTPRITTSLSNGELSYIRLAKRHRTVGGMARDLRRADATIKSKLRGRLIFNPIFNWKPQHKLFLDEHRQNGWGWCAEQLGVSVVAVRSQARRWGLSKKHLTNFTGLQQHYAAGLTTREIGNVLGVSDECIRNHLIQMGIDRPGRNERWRNSQKRRDTCRLVAQKKKAIHRKRAAELGWPGTHYSHAVILEALRTIGSGDRDALAAACGEVCRARGWKVKYTNPLSLLSFTTALARRGLIQQVGKGNQRRQFSLASAAVGSIGA